MSKVERKHGEVFVADDGDLALYDENNPTWPWWLILANGRRIFGLPTREDIGFAGLGEFKISQIKALPDSRVDLRSKGIPKEWKAKVKAYEAERNKEEK